MANLTVNNFEELDQSVSFANNLRQEKTVQEIKDSADVTEQITATKTVNEINQSIDFADDLRKLKTPSQIGDSVEATNRILNKGFVRASEKGITGENDADAYLDLLSSEKFIFNDISPHIEKLITLNGLDDVVIVGKKITTPTRNAINIINSSNITFFKTGIISTSTETSNFSAGLIAGGGSNIKNVRFIDCYFSAPNANTNGIKFVMETDHTLDVMKFVGCTFENIGRMAIEFQNHNDSLPITYRYKNIAVEDCTFKNIGLIQFGMCVSFSGWGENCKANNNTFEGHSGAGVEMVGVKKGEIIGNVETNPSVGGMLLSVTKGNVGRTNYDLKIKNNEADSNNTILFSYTEGLKLSGNKFKVNNNIVEFREVKGLRSYGDEFRTTGVHAIYYNGGSDNSITGGVIDNSDSTNNFSTFRSNAGESMKLINTEIVKNLSGGKRYDFIGDGVNPTFRDCLVGGVVTHDAVPVGGMVPKGMFKFSETDSASFSVTFSDSSSWLPASIKVNVTSCKYSGGNFAFDSFIINLKHQVDNGIADVRFNSFLGASNLSTTTTKSGNTLTVQVQNTLSSEAVNFVFDVVVMSEVGAIIQ